MGEKVETFNYFDLLTTKTHLESLILTNFDTRSFIKHNLRYTQEFGDCYLDDWFVLLKESSIYRKTKVGHLAYSYPRMPNDIVDQFLVLESLKSPDCFDHFVFKSGIFQGRIVSIASSNYDEIITTQYVEGVKLHFRIDLRLYWCIKDSILLCWFFFRHMQSLNLYTCISRITEIANVILSDAKIWRLNNTFLVTWISILISARYTFLDSILPEKIVSFYLKVNWLFKLFSFGTIPSRYWMKENKIFNRIDLGVFGLFRLYFFNDWLYLV